jgi:hypothetical protein
MKKILAVVIVLAVCAVGFGFYRGWFALSSPSPSAGSNEVNINLATDTDKMKEDAQTVKDKAAELTDNVTDGSDEPVDRPETQVSPRHGATDDGQIPTGEPEQVHSSGNEQ